MSNLAFIHSMTKKDLLRKFSTHAGILFVAWIFLYHVILIPFTEINAILTSMVQFGTRLGLNVFGYSAEIQGSVVMIGSKPAVSIEDACNGLELFALYTGFLIAFPGKWKFKLVFIPIGILFIFVINVIRNMALTLNYLYFQQTFDFNHKYTYVLIVYSIVFLIWRYWMNRYSILAEQK